MPIWKWYVNTVWLALQCGNSPWSPFSFESGDGGPHGNKVSTSDDKRLQQPHTCHRGSRRNMGGVFSLTRWSINLQALNAWQCEFMMMVVTCGAHSLYKTTAHGSFVDVGVDNRLPRRQVEPVQPVHLSQVAFMAGAVSFQIRSWDTHEHRVS